MTEEEYWSSLHSNSSIVASKPDTTPGTLCKVEMSQVWLAPSAPTLLLKTPFSSTGVECKQDQFIGYFLNEYTVREQCTSASAILAQSCQRPVCTFI